MVGGKMKDWTKHHQLIFQINVLFHAIAKKIMRVNHNSNHKIVCVKRLGKFLRVVCS